MHELADVALELLANADQIATELLSVPDNVPGSLPPLPIPPMSEEWKRSVDEEFERIRREAEDWERSQQQPPLWDRFKDAYKRTGDNMIDRARDFINDDIRTYREKQAQERWQEETSKQLHEKYPQGYQKHESQATSVSSQAESGTSKGDSGTSKGDSGTTNSGSASDKPSSGGGSSGGDRPTESPSLNFSRSSEAAGRPRAETKPDVEAKPDLEASRDADHKDEIDVES